MSIKNFFKAVSCGNAGMPDAMVDYVRRTGDAEYVNHGDFYKWEMGDGFYKSPENPNREWSNAQYRYQEGSYSNLHSEHANNQRRVRDANVNVSIIADKIATEVEIWMAEKGIVLPQYAEIFVNRWYSTYGHNFNDAERAKIKEILGEAMAIVRNNLREERMREDYERIAGDMGDKRRPPDRKTHDERVYGKKVDGFWNQAFGKRYKEHK